MTGPCESRSSPGTAGCAMRGLVPGLASPVPARRDLPSLYRDDYFAQNLCAGLDEVLAPIIATLDSLPAYLDPATAPDDMLAWLAGWMGIVLDGHQTAERQRELVQEGVDILHWRGTARGVRAAVGALFDGTTGDHRVRWGGDLDRARLPRCPAPTGRIGGAAGGQRSRGLRRAPAGRPGRDGQARAHAAPGRGVQAA